MLRRLIFRDIFSALRHSSEKQRERKQERERQRRGREKDAVDNFAKREAERRAISTFTRCVTKKTENAEETLIRAHSITRIKTPRLAFRVFPTANSSFRPIFSLSLPSFFPPPYHPPPSSLLVLAIGSFYHAPKARCSPPLYPHPFYLVASLEKSGIRSSLVSGHNVAMSLAYFSPLALGAFSVSAYFFFFLTYSLSLSSLTCEQFSQIHIRWVNRDVRR